MAKVWSPGRFESLPVASSPQNGKTRVHADPYAAFNNAGISTERPLHEYSAAELEDVISTDLRGVFLAMKHEIPHML